MSTPEHFAKRVILEAMCDASRSYWLRRAETFERARPVLGGFYGNQTPEQCRAKWLELTEIAIACRNKAALCAPDEAATDLDNVWSETAA